MSLKIGDKVTIRSKEWLEENADAWINHAMFAFAGKSAIVTSFSHVDFWRLQIEGHDYSYVWKEGSFNLISSRIAIIKKAKEIIRLLGVRAVATIENGKWIYFQKDLPIEPLTRSGVWMVYNVSDVMFLPVTALDPWPDSWKTSLITEETEEK